MTCPKCGAEIPNDSKFCAFCGSGVEMPSKQMEQPAEELEKDQKEEATAGLAEETAKMSKYNPVGKETKGRIPHIPSIEPERASQKQAETLKTKIDEIKREAVLRWRTLSTFGKIATAAIAAFLLLFMLALMMGIGGSKGGSSSKPSGGKVLTANTTFDEITPVVSATATIEPSTEYAFMTDAWNVYIAKAVSSNVIKVESWHKSSQSDKKMKLRGDLGSFKIDDEANGFSWVDDEHTAFTLIIQDKNNSEVKKPTAVVFTINTSDSDTDKGTDYDKKIACYEYVNDDWHTYRAIALSDHLVKIECWYRTSSGFWESHRFGWDVGVIDTDNTNTDFEWGDEQHRAFTITMIDPANGSYWKEEKLTSFILENEGYKYSTVLSFLGKASEPEEPSKDALPEVQETETQPAETETTPTETETTPEETKPVEITEEKKEPSVILPESSTKLGKDFDMKGSSTVYYINVDGTKNKPTLKEWGSAVVTDGVAEYLDYLKDQGCTVTITSYEKRSPYSGFTLYETYFDVKNETISWDMYLCIEDEKYVEYELDINLP